MSYTYMFIDVMYNYVTAYENLKANDQDFIDFPQG